MTTELDKFIIQKNAWPRFARLGLLWQSMRGRRLLYSLGIFALLVEAFFAFSAPLVVKLSIDSVIGTQAPVIPAPLYPLAQLILGPDLAGGGLVGPAPAKVATNAAAHWVWQPWLRQNLWIMGLAFACLVALQALASFIANYCANSAAEHGAKTLRDRLYSHIQRLPYESLLRAQSGDWLQRCTSDVDTCRRFLGFELFEICRTFFLIALAYPVMISLDPGLTLWGSLAIPVILIFSIVFHRVVEKVFLNVDEREGVLSGIIQENVTGLRLVRAYARQSFELQRFGQANNQFRDQIYRLIAWMALYWGLTSALGIIQLALVLGMGITLIASSGISLGLIVLFLAYEQQILWPIRQFGRILADAGKTKVALGRMAEILALCQEQGFYEAEGACDSDWSRGQIEFERVSFTYPDGKVVLHDLSFTIAAGEHLAIVGPTGSGKSTLVHLLLRLYEPSAGCIKINGRDIRSIPKAELRSKIALVLQEGFLFGRSVEQNVRVAKPDATQEHLNQAAQAACLHTVVEQMADTWDTMVGERGVTLSGGQQQRLALARALIRQTPILVLDDSLSAVDTETDALVRKALRHPSPEKPAVSTIIIAHRLTTLASADRILVIENGRISALGTHAELIQQAGLYQRLANLQNDSSEPNHKEHSHG